MTSDKQLYHCASCNRDYDFATQGAVCPHRDRTDGGVDKLEPWPHRHPSSNQRLTLAERCERLAEKMRKGEQPFIGLGFMQELAVALKALPAHETPARLTDEDETQIGRAQADLAVLKKDARTYNIRRIAGQALEVITLLKARRSSVETIGDDARDAARYRFLCEHQLLDASRQALKPELDAHVDALLARAAEKATELPVKCKNCDGRGTITRHSAGGYDQTKTCARCSGTGIEPTK